MKQYNPKLFLRQVPNDTLAQFFSRFDTFADFDWSRVTERKPDPVFDLWQELPDADRRKVGCIFRQVHSLATPRGATVLIEAARDRGLDILEQMRPRKNGHDRALWCYLNHPGVVGDAKSLAHIESLPRRSWEKRNGLPKREVEVTAESVAALSQALSEYYVERQGRGERCQVEYRRRAGGVDSFFAYPADYIDERMGYTENGELDRRPWNGVFEVVFNYCGAEGAIEMFAEGGRKVRDELSEMFTQCVLNEDQMPKPTRRPAFNLDVFRNSDITFPSDPEDGIRSVRVKAIQLQVVGSVGGKITFEIGRQWHRASAYDLFAESVGAPRLGLKDTLIREVRLHAVVRNSGGKRDRNITFRLSESSCDLGDGFEEQILRSKFREWGIEQDA